MIPTFPRFTRLTLDHKQIVEDITSHYKPYSDYNFTSLFSWNINESAKLSLLNKNLIIKYPDYITGEESFSMIGSSDIDESLHKISKYTNKLNLVPEETITHIKNPENFGIVYDSGNYDYIFSIDEHAGLSGRKFKWKRKKYNRIQKDLSDKLEVSKIDFNSRLFRNEILEIFDCWKTQKQKNDNEIANERTAIIRALESGVELGLSGLLLKIDQTPIGFSIVELLKNNYSMYHFQKCTLDYANIDIYLTSVQSKELKKQGVKLINWEQDLDIEGLRTLKKSYFPYDLLRKFTINL